MGPWKVWVKDPAWRVLAYYKTRREADRAAREARADGQLARACRDGSLIDLLTYRDPGRDAERGRDAQA